MAEKSFNEAIEIYRSLPDGERYAYYMAEAKNELSYCYLNQDRVEQALKTIDEAIQLRPKDPNYLDSKGEFLLAMDRKEEALDAYHQIIQVEENYYQKNGTVFYKGLKERGLVE